MPDLPSWIHRAPIILNILQKPDIPPILDRIAVESLFGISPRQANRLIRGCPATFKTGRSVLVPTSSLIALVSARLASGVVETETNRQQRLSAALASVRHEAVRRRIVIPTRDDVHDRTLADLPAGIVLEPGLLRIRYDSPLDLLEKLFELSQALSNDLTNLESLSPAAPPGQGTTDPGSWRHCP